jgi:hypothetical protein
MGMPRVSSRGLQSFVRSRLVLVRGPGSGRRRAPRASSSSQQLLLVLRALLVSPRSERRPIRAQGHLTLRRLVKGSFQRLLEALRWSPGHQLAVDAETTAELLNTRPRPKPPQSRRPWSPKWPFSKQPNRRAPTEPAWRSSGLPPEPDAGRIERAPLRGSHHPHTRGHVTPGAPGLAVSGAAAADSSVRVRLEARLLVGRHRTDTSGRQHGRGHTRGYGQLPRGAGRLRCRAVAIPRQQYVAAKGAPWRRPASL